ncbi:hypothetical protein NDU88_007802, partial [Pleurodeles waltl]
INTSFGAFFTMANKRWKCKALLFLSLCSVMKNFQVNADAKEGEILPPTIHKLMKGYNKYLRPFFD